MTGAGRAFSVRIDRSKTLAEEPHTGHNRWHEAIPPILRVEDGEVVELDTRDAFDLQLTPSSTIADVMRADLGRAHPLTGPVYVEGAAPGDALEVYIREVRPQPYGCTVQVPGFGFLRDDFPEPYIVHWEMDGGYAVSRDLPGVRIPGAPFMGVMGVAPSRALRESIAAREDQLRARGGIALPPEPATAVPADPAIAAEALRTIPPRENGGNLDIRHLGAGTTVLLPVWVPGALFSVGDGHYAQGDGEVCGTAIEMGATFVAELRVRKGEAERLGMRGVHYRRTSPAAAAPRPFYATTGLCLHTDGSNAFEDATLAARSAMRAMIDVLVRERGYTRQQAYAICSVAVNLQLSQVVDLPNFVVSAVLPLDIFV